jgi:hypothetical protein
MGIGRISRSGIRIQLIKPAPQPPKGGVRQLNHEGHFIYLHPQKSPLQGDLGGK